ncbi:nitrogen fixation protein NifM [Stutzerimonas kirkiae]|uniref:nitrogen fixation protein NifM n=1 Tax=Stutzerimonas kirkiae TaxID=2211392 RepID=UPI0010383D28|nr:nitrogen fixation protein NifM [Stutzerimonas kirkiae]TBV09698.1 nitrogen fixation protein NifM [Stutzerimonas kirkiae]
MGTDVRLDGDARYLLLKVAHERFGRGPGELDEGQLQQARRIVERHLQIEGAVLRSPQALGVVIPPAQVEQAWTQIGERYASPAALQQALHDSGLDGRQVRGLLARELKVEAVLERVCAGLPALSDTDLGLYYFNHPERFLRPPSRQARHILITVNPDYPENIREAALARIEAIAGRLRSKPERFAEQALKHSECPTSLQGGQLGNIRPGMLYPELDACLFALQPGRIGPVVESPLGFHLLLCEAVVPAMQLPLEAVLPHLRETLQQRQRQAHQRRWLESLLQQAPPMENQAHG